MPAAAVPKVPRQQVVDFAERQPGTDVLLVSSSVIVSGRVTAAEVQPQAVARAARSNVDVYPQRCPISACPRAGVLL